MHLLHPTQLSPTWGSLLGLLHLMCVTTLTKCNLGWVVWKFCVPMGSIAALISCNLLGLSCKLSFKINVRSKTGGFPARGKNGFLCPSSALNKIQLIQVKATLSLFTFLLFYVLVLYFLCLHSILEELKISTCGPWFEVHS